LDAAAARLLRVEAGAAEESVGAVLGNELEAALRRGGTDDRYRFLHRLRPGLAILEREMLARMGHTVLAPQALDQRDPFFRVVVAIILEIGRVETHLRIFALVRG